MTRCLSCEIHVIYRVVMRFSADCIKNNQYLAPVNKIIEVFGANNVHVDFQNEKNHYPSLAFIMVDVKMPNQQKRTLMHTAKVIEQIIKRNLTEDDLDEGFIEIYEPQEIVELISWEILKVCKPKKKKLHV